MIIRNLYCHSESHASCHSEGVGRPKNLAEATQTLPPPRRGQGDISRDCISPLPKYLLTAKGDYLYANA